MIGQAMEIMLFGMLGIFLVMGVIILTIAALERTFGGASGKEQ